MYPLNAAINKNAGLTPKARTAQQPQLLPAILVLSHMNEEASHTRSRQHGMVGPGLELKLEVNAHHMPCLKTHTTFGLSRQSYLGHKWHGEWETHADQLRASL